MRSVKLLISRVGKKPVLLGLFFAAILFLFLGRAAARPGQDPFSKHSVLGYTIIPISIPSSKNIATPQSTTDISAVANQTLPPKHVGLAASSAPELQQLAQVEQTSGGAVASGMMIFTNMPDSTNSARSAAADMYSKLNEFAKFGLKPVVVMEPTNSQGVINFASYKNGAYDPILNAYFQALKSLGATDRTMGMWVYFPEADLVEWGPVDVADFAPNVTRSIQIQKQYFPTSQSSILLDAMSYPAGSTSYDDGSYVSLLPFVSGIPKGLVDSFGLQGFPWMPPANQKGDTNLNPSVFLNSSLAAEAAKQLGTSSIWLNTGTFAAMYTNNSAQTVSVSATQRQNILSGILTQATKLKSSGFSVTINLFGENKSNTSEATDWSYQTADAQAVFNSFVLQLGANHIDLWLFEG